MAAREAPLRLRTGGRQRAIGGLPTPSAFEPLQEICFAFLRVPQCVTPPPFRCPVFDARGVLAAQRVVKESGSKRALATPRSAVGARPRRLAPPLRWHVAPPPRAPSSSSGPAAPPLSRRAVGRTSRRSTSLPKMAPVLRAAVAAACAGGDCPAPSGFAGLKVGGQAGRGDGRPGTEAGRPRDAVRSRRPHPEAPQVGGGGGGLRQGAPPSHAGGRGCRDGAPFS